MQEEEDIEVSPHAVGDFTSSCFNNANSSTPVTQLVIPGLDPSVYIDEETQMNFVEGALESPREIMSPADPEDASSPFEAMESDDVDESAVSDRNENSYRRHLPPDHSQFLSTTTPGGSSDDEDPYSSSSSRKKRRRTHRRGMQPFQWSNFHKYQSPASSQVPSPAPSNEAWLNETGEDSSACPTPFYNRQRNTSQPNVLSNNSDSNLQATFSRRLSNTSTEQTPSSRLVLFLYQLLNLKLYFYLAH